MTPRAILFDLDGTLIETIHLYYDACKQALSAFGMELSDTEFRRGYTYGIGLEDWIRDLGGDVAVLAAVRTKQDEVYIELLRARSDFLPGALELLHEIGNIPRAIVTGSWRTYVDAIHEKIGIGDHFEHIVTVDDMLPYYKPHPHGFLLAADKLGVEPKDCLVVGDQTFDIDAAKAGGMQSCLVVTSHTPKHAQGTAEHEVHTLAELRALIGKL